MAPFGARDQISAVLAFMNERELSGYNNMEYVIIRWLVFNRETRWQLPPGTDKMTLLNISIK